MNILHGIYLLATGRSRGLEKFGAGRRDFLISLLMLLCVPILAALVSIGQYGVRPAAGLALVLTCALMAPPVISHALARFWGREVLWPRFATAFNWSRAGVVAVFAIMLVVTAILIQMGFPREAAGELLLGGMSIYSLWLEWFIARHGLQISTARAVISVLAINGTTFLLLGIPSVVARMFESGAPPG